MNIAIALNQNYFRYAFVLIDSILCNHPETELSFYLLNVDLREDQIRKIRDYASKYGAEIWDTKIINELFPEDLPLPDERFSKEIYFRLAMADVIPEDVERILYLDVDTVVIQNIEEMYHLDFGDAYFMACKEHHDAFEDSRGVLFNERLKKGYTYFNSGVILMNLKALRENGFYLKKYLELLQPILPYTTCPDQDLLNYVHPENISYLDAEHYVDQNPYNLFARYAWNLRKSYEQVKEEARIIHYSGFKPWNANGLRYDLEYLWWEYARHIPYYTELMEEYVYKTMMDSTIPNSYIHLLNENGRLHNIDEQLTAQNEKLKADLKESMEINQELLRLLQAK